MPLSEHEQRVFDEIERSLADDPKFASAVRSQDPHRRSKRRIVVGALISLAGLAVMVSGVMLDELWLGVLGAVVTFAGMVYAVQTQRKAASGELSAVDGKAKRKTGRPRSSRRHSSGGGGLTDRLEERWRRRRDNGWQ